METLTGYAKLDELRMSAASSPTGIIKVSIEDLNTIAEEIAAQQKRAADKCHKSPSGNHVFDGEDVFSECSFCGTCR